MGAVDELLNMSFVDIGCATSTHCRRTQDTNLVVIGFARRR